MRHQLPAGCSIMTQDFALWTEEEAGSGILPQAGIVTFIRSAEGLYEWLVPGSPGNSGRIAVHAVPEGTGLGELADIAGDCPYALLTGTSGQPSGMVRMSDVRRELALAYRQLKAGFDAALEASEIAITVINEHSEVIAWTADAERMFGIRRDDILGKQASDFFPKERLQVLRTLHTGDAVRQMQHQPRQDIHAMINARPIELDGKVIGAVAAEIDITSQIRMNKQLFTMAAKVQHLEREVAKLSPTSDPFASIKGTSAALKTSVETARKIGSTQATALILGESGVGKELYARAIHDSREKAGAPFIAINCGAIPPSLFESELFGYERGAFSGADPRGKKGKIEMAGGGTLFLDEIGEMPLDMQVKLLRVLQEKKYYAVGGSALKLADCRIIAATNRDLKAMIADNKFREDLYYRLNVVTLDVPPLRHRKSDIYELIQTFLPEFSVAYGRFIEACPSEVVQAMMSYDWPGNVRELRNAVERLVILSSDGELKPEYLPGPVLSAPGSAPPAAPVKEAQAGARLQSMKDEVEKQKILEMLEAEKGNKRAVAKKLDISRATLYNRMKRLGLPL
ncbi:MULTISPECIES: sigma 54-interacting transcriptional regulator [unclassified Paenibacillus]|uniref:sigma-54 interaction domain-containing protein n=1 Tax=unclassified Paenibacillus TaxID=185978 RepID=UPI000956FCB5|nr:MULTISPECIES: sigma 54-interacting transcriptional regulator [unclassified Paenibacillus]SIQ76687.1 PAS domain S-box-containing protein [Paenibacillus sp. RU4X]SIQ98089.1 PAS domain S-box-containing protein [Paenibacillus sp. RU4T]